MPIICDDYDLLFTHVPKAGGSFVSKVLHAHLGGRRLGRKHLTYRLAELDGPPPSRRFFVVREPVSWYRSYWAYARAAMKHPGAWPIWADGDRRHPTHELDRRCGAKSFERFISNSLREFPNGYVRSMYCDFLNGSTLALRAECLIDDLERLLDVVGFDNPQIVRSIDAVNETPSAWKDKATLRPQLERTLREVENLDGLDLPYFD